MFMSSKPGFLRLYKCKLLFLIKTLKADFGHEQLLSVLVCQLFVS